MSPAFIDSPLFGYVILPLLIFIARIVDVSIGTVRIMLIARGRKIITPILGFFEVLIWLLAVRQIMQNLTNVYCYIAFAGGFAMGNYVGMYIEEKLALGAQVIRIITKEDIGDLRKAFKEAGFGLTVVDAHGSMGKVNILFTIVQRCSLKMVVEIIKKFNPKAFYSVEDIKSVSEGIFPNQNSADLWWWHGKGEVKK